MLGGECICCCKVTNAQRDSIVTLTDLLCEKLFKVKADAQQLYYKEPFMGMPELLEPDDYDIAYLGVKDGSSVLVEEKS